MAYDPSEWFRYGGQLEKVDNEQPKYQQNRENNLYYRNQSVDYAVKPHPGVANDVSFYNKNKEHASEYDPLAPSITSAGFDLQHEKPDPKKLDYYITMLQKFIRPLPHDLKKMLPYDVICQLAHTMLDGTVIDIAKGLRDIQNITEKNLSTKRSKLVNEQITRKDDILKRHKNEIQSLQGRPHQIIVVEKSHAEEMKTFREKCEKDIAAMDQNLVLELDQQVSDQQATLERAGMPLFFITNNPGEVKLQMYILKFIIKISSC